MKKVIAKCLTCAAALALLAVSAVSLLAYIQPMEDAVYDFTLGWEGAGEGTGTTGRRPAPRTPRRWTGR